MLLYPTILCMFTYQLAQAACKIDILNEAGELVTS